ncbi:mannose-6-phosphate isomerase [marine bacterium AO1-C]|nr:mannose-6-phosphate isomerase [marine bacterium AO1-C]
MNNKINLAEKFDLFKDHWNPRILGELNGQYVKIAKFKDAFVWHKHDHEDELFLVIKGTLLIDFREKTVELNTGEMIIVPKGVEHRPRTNEGEEVQVMLFEPKNTLNTGDQSASDFTKENLEKI